MCQNKNDCSEKLQIVIITLIHWPFCHRCGINVFEYLCDIIDRCAAWFPNTSIEKYRDLLPGKWKQTQK